MAKISKTTQSFIPIKDIKDGIVIMKDGSLRLVLITSSINFALRSHEEQVAILLQYQNLLNSLDFSAQIFVQSRLLDINPYLATLQERLTAEKENELLRIQIKEYINFIRAFTEDTRIMEKRFFVILSYVPTFDSSGKGFSNMIGLGNKQSQIEQNEWRFNEGKTQLEQRAVIVEQGLASCGITSQRLSSEGLMELFYKFFNPGESAKPFVAGLADK